MTYTITLPNLKGIPLTSMAANLITTNAWGIWLKEQGITEVELISDGYSPHTLEFQKESDAMAFKLQFSGC